MSGSGAARERLSEAWIELRDNPGRSVLQALGVILGVAAVLGGFSISDSMRRQSERLFARVGGTDKLNVMPREAVGDGTPSALRTANLGLRLDDAHRGSALTSGKGIDGVSVFKETRARVRSDFADEDRRVTGIDADYLPLNGYEVEQGRGFSARELEEGSPVALLGSAAVEVFFPTGEVVGQRIRVGDTPVMVVGVLREKVFRFRANQGNVLSWRNRVVALPARLVARRMQGDAYARVDRVTFRMPDLGAMASFSKELSSLVTANHRLQRDFRLDDVAARIKRQRAQGDVYNIIFMLSGVLSLIGGGMVNVNIQLASLKDRVREVGVKMAIGAPGREIFLGFMTEALLLTLLGSAVGLLAGIAFSKLITASIETPLSFAPMSFLWAVLLAGVFGFLFALYPAWKASRLSPMEALRYE
jgi:ABC-type antimicrobial peptide transport system permease subunit